MGLMVSRLPDPFESPRVGSEHGPEANAPQMALALLFMVGGLLAVALFGAFGLALLIGGVRPGPVLYAATVFMIAAGGLASAPLFRQSVCFRHGRARLTVMEWLLWLSAGFTSFCTSCWLVYQAISAS